MARLVRIETDPPGASVLLESGASIGKTPLQVDVASLAGRKVVLSKDGYERQSVPAEALAAGPAFRAELQPLIGTVEAIQAIPWAKVYLGNRLLGETPLTAVRLPAGEQRLRFVNEPLGVDQVKIIVVRPGDNPKIIVPMTGSGRGRPEFRLPRHALVEGNLSFPLFRAGDLQRQPDGFRASGVEGGAPSPQGSRFPGSGEPPRTEGATRRPAAPHVRIRYPRPMRFTPRTCPTGRGSPGTG